MGLFDKIFGGNKDNSGVIKGERWNFYTYTYGEGQVAMVEFDEAIGSETTHSGYNNCIRVIFYINPANCTETGLPVKKEHERLVEIEMDLNKNISADCRFVARSSYGALRELIYQVNDVATFKTDYTHWAKRIDIYKLELRESAGWQFFDERIKPDYLYWQQIHDRRIIGTLLQNGSSASKPHVIEHTILGEAAKLQSLAQQLTQDGFTVQTMENNSLVISKPMLLDGNTISGLTMRLASYCRSLGLKYDGWGAAIVK
ncbi:MAG: ribonuclease E inhibitor RraB [Chitinophagales bacterium]